jgi:histidine triad (HIT) family protein
VPCIFCEIAGGERPARIVYEDEHAVAFHDINPQAPTHILIIPRDHIDGPAATSADNEAVIGHLVTVAARIAADEGISAGGYRLVLNQGRNGGQSVFHVHMHLLGGRRMGWPPG